MHFIVAFRCFCFVQSDRLALGALSRLFWGFARGQDEAGVVVSAVVPPPPTLKAWFWSGKREAGAAVRVSGPERRGGAPVCRAWCLRIVMQTHAFLDLEIRSLHFVPFSYLPLMSEAGSTGRDRKKACPPRPFTVSPSLEVTTMTRLKIFRRRELPCPFGFPLQCKYLFCGIYSWIICSEIS